MEKENLSKVWPILYFEADWPSKSYNFDLGIQLIKADKNTLEEITKYDIDNNCWLSNIAGADHMRDNTGWFLAMHRPELNEHISANEIGMSFVDSLQEAIKESFLMTLQLVRSTAAICPFEFPAEIREDSISSDDVDTSSDFYGINSDKPPVYSPEIFKIGDLQLITDLWSALIKLRKLDDWASRISKEEFFADLDKKAGEGAVKKFVDTIMSVPAFLEFTEEERKQHKDKLTALAKDAINKGEEFLKEFYKDSFQKIFLEKQEEIFSNRTRIGRALNLFFEGLHLPLQHSFLSMCLVLETIFTVEEAEITYQFATRLANITGKTFEQRKDIFERARKVYRERSNIVHGRKLIQTVDPNILKDAFLFARQSLQHILFDDTRMKLYSDPITSDKTKDCVKAIKAIKEYFRDLDLRCDW
jgi:hypothetical protein